MGRAVMDFLKTHRSELLMCAFIAQMLAQPLADENPHIGGVLALLLMLLLLVGASYMANRRIVRFVAAPLAGIWLIARALEAFGDSSHMYTHLAPVAGLALSCAILWAILNRFNSVPTVNTSVISEAFISYLVLAIAFSQVYWILNRILPNPFNQVVPSSHDSTLLYFSMITLSTVGYGGVAP